MQKIKAKLLLAIIWLIIIGLLLLTRLINLDWGLPYPMHPDERNMANAVLELNCQVSNGQLQILNCFNPHFFAYGQFSLYLAYIITFILKFFDGDLVYPIGFQEAIISLRIISASASIITTWILIKIVRLILLSKNNKQKNISFFQQLIIGLILIFSPYAIQLAHFGTTESLLMLFYSLIIYLTLKYQNNQLKIVSYSFKVAVISGLALATKMSSAVFLAIPILAFVKAFLSQQHNNINIKIKSRARSVFNPRLFIIGLIIIFLLVTLTIAVLFSPHNLINFKDFISSMAYESDVALGNYIAFYTRQFVDTIPIWFQLINIFPYALGLGALFLGIIGFFGGLSFFDTNINWLRIAFLIYFIPNSIIFAKWSRFMAPVFPILLVLSIITLLRLNVSNILKIILTFTIIIPGIVYLFVYIKPDSRFQASEWIYKNIPENSYILSETANVVDIPIQNPKSKTQNQNKNYNIISFNFYDLDTNYLLQEELKNHLSKADYIFVPSRRVFSNHTCLDNSPILSNHLDIIANNFNNRCAKLKQQYPLLNQYYEDLFSGKLRFTKVAEFSANLNDEQAEETWTVFDHPVIRIYKKISKSY